MGGGETNECGGYVWYRNIIAGMARNKLNLRKLGSEWRSAVFRLLRKNSGAYGSDVSVEGAVVRELTGWREDIYGYSIWLCDGNRANMTCLVEGHKKIMGKDGCANS